MKLLEERLRETKRLVILRLVAALERRRIDLMTLRSALRDLGHETERDVLVSELRWLDRQSLLRLDDLAGGGLLITLTERGDMAQRGEIEEPGVARPDLP